MSEQWRPIPGYEGKYEVSDQGRVRSLRRKAGNCTRRGQILKQSPGRAGYLRVTLSGGSEGAKRFWSVHVLVLTAFVSERPPGMFGLHGNGNHLDNTLSNLRWGTPSDNVQDALRHGTHWQVRKTHCVRGHAYDEANTSLIRSDSRRTYRKCRTCAAMRERKRRAALKAAGA